MCIYKYICIYVYMYMYIYMYVYVNIYIYIYQVVWPGFSTSPQHGLQQHAAADVLRPLQGQTDEARRVWAIRGADGVLGEARWGWEPPSAAINLPPPDI